MPAASPLTERGSSPPQAAESGASTGPAGEAPTGIGAAWRPALRWVGLALVMIALVVFFLGQHQPDTFGCEVDVTRGVEPEDPPDYVRVEACGELVFQGSRDAAEEFLRRAEAGASAAAYTAAAAVLAGAGAVLVAVGNLGAPARRRVSAAGRVGLAAAGAAAGFAAALLAVAAVITPAYRLGLLMDESELAALGFLVPAYAILGAVFGAVYRPVARGTEPTTGANRLAIGGFVCSLVGLMAALWLGPLSAVLLSLPGIVLGVLGATKSAALPAGRGLAWWAVGLGAAGIVGAVALASRML